MTGIDWSSVGHTTSLVTMPLRVAGRVASQMAWRSLRQRPALRKRLRRQLAGELLALLSRFEAGTVKAGQLLPVLEVAFPDELAEAYRASLAGITMPPVLAPAELHGVLARELGPGWRGRFGHLDEEPAAVTGLSQVHRGRWHDGREIAVKIRRAGSHTAVRRDFRLYDRLAGLAGIVHPSFDSRALAAEFRRSLLDELDYVAEARHQRAFAAAYADSTQVLIPDVVHVGGRVLVMEWIGGAALDTDLDQERRDQVGRLLLEFQLSAPTRAGLVHADPHPSNFRLLSDGRLGILDFGAAAEPSAGSPALFGELCRAGAAMRADDTFDALCRLGFLAPATTGTPQQAIALLGPMLATMRAPEFHFSPQWFHAQTRHVTELDGALRFLAHLRLPPEHVPMCRMALGTAALLARLHATVDVRTVVDRWLAAPTQPPAQQRRDDHGGPPPSDMPA